MKSSLIRKQFLDFFTEKGHQIVDSAPLVLKDDPTLMFVNAGMNPFKDIFLGNSEPKYPRVANSQKCLRVSGKHNDLEEVGVDTYHHTLFEMLGNWSFGDYFKEEAIAWAWEFLTECVEVDPSYLYVTVFGGDKGDGLARDNEAAELWGKYISADRILDGSKKDNFWEMGDVGPCGPCSEIHVDIRSAADKAKVDGRTLINEDHPQVIEVWNLVFMQYSRQSNGSLQSLPNRHVDTGMGFERLCMVLQGKQSNYDTDVFTPYLSKLESLSGLKYTATDSLQDVAFRVISDHIRAVSFSIADGQLPATNGAGYVIRRILRRAIRYGYSYLNFQEPFMHELVAVLVAEMGSHFGNLKKQEQLIAKVIKEEEQGFLKTLEKGIQRIEDIANQGIKKMDGAQIFELYDTFGFPYDLTALILKEKNIAHVEAEFLAALEEQKIRSRAAGKIETGDWVKLTETSPEQLFVGYDTLETESDLLQYREVLVKGKKRFQWYLNPVPFYPEGGGQVGDKGYLDCGGAKIAVLDTKKENGQILVITEEEPQASVSKIKCVVNLEARNASAKNHTATHLLHHVLRKTLGTHVEQKGSLVSEKYLRFDFSHFEKVSDEQIASIELEVNKLILENLFLDENRNSTIEAAKEKGALMLFGEKYGDTVRVIGFGNSVELCGGTHVSSSGAIGLFKITTESSVAAGIRRIEALTGLGAIHYVNTKIEALNSVGEAVKNTKNTLAAIEQLVEQNKKLSIEVDAFKKEQALNMQTDVLKDIKDINGYRFLSVQTDLAPDLIKDICFGLKGEENLVAVFGGENAGKAFLAIMVSEDLIKSKGLNAGAMIKIAAKPIQGGGGGQPFYASAGGQNPSGIPQAFKAVETLLL